MLAAAEVTQVRNWMADAAQVLARVEQVTFACADPSVYVDLLRVLRTYHFVLYGEPGKHEVALPGRTGRADVRLLPSVTCIVAEPVPGEALRHGSAVSPNLVRNAGGRRGYRDTSPDAALKRELLARPGQRQPKR